MCQSLSADSSGAESEKLSVANTVPHSPLYKLYLIMVIVEIKLLLRFLSQGLAAGVILKHKSQISLGAKLLEANWRFFQKTIAN